MTSLVYYKDHVEDILVYARPTYMMSYQQVSFQHNLMTVSGWLSGLIARLPLAQ